jgi:hypothetical protein
MSRGRLRWCKNVWPPAHPDASDAKANLKVSGTGGTS